MILKNKGMFLEEILNNSIQYSDGFILQKVPTGNKIISSLDDNFSKVKLQKSNFCDYVGLYKGMYIELEAKEFEGDYFKKSNITKTQLDKLSIVEENGGLSLFAIYSHKKNKIYFISLSELMKYDKRIPIEEFENNFISFEVENYFYRNKKSI